MDTLALILSIIGAVNWGLVGICQFDLVAWLFGGQTGVVSRIIYTLVGLAGLWCVSLLFRRQNRVGIVLSRILRKSSVKYTSGACCSGIGPDRPLQDFAHDPVSWQNPVGASLDASALQQAPLF